MNKNIVAVLGILAFAVVGYIAFQSSGYSNEPVGPKTETPTNGNGVSDG